jgi:hypothetical protein
VFGVYFTLGSAITDLCPAHVLFQTLRVTTNTHDTNAIEISPALGAGTKLIGHN